MADGLLALHLLRGIRVAQSMILMAILLLLDLPSLLGSLGLYSSPAVGLAWYGLLLLVALVDFAIGARHRFWGRASWPVAAFVLALSWAATSALPGSALLTPAHWTFGVVGWFGLLIFADSPIRHALVFIGLHIGSTVVLVAMEAGLATTWVRLATVTVGVHSYQLAAIVATSVLRRVADEATRVAEARAQAATRESVARQVHADREARYATLRDAALPLLRGISDESQPPSDPDVRRRAAVEAARMRRLFGEDSDDDAPLAAEVAALVDVVERRGVTVRYAARPVVGEPPAPVRRAMVEAVSGALLGTVRTARVTVGGTDTDVTVSVVTDTVLDGPEGSSHEGGVHTSTIVDGDRTWVEARWVMEQDRQP